MPILAKEEDLYPLNLLEEGNSLPSDQSWYAMYTLARHEKELMRRLRAIEVAHYGPLVPQRKRSPAGRIRLSYVPLFTGYVFVCGTNVHRYEAVSTGCVSRCIEVKDDGQLPEDLRRIRRLLEIGPEVRPEPKPLVGRAALIKRGAMVGMKGTVAKVDNQHRLVVMVTFMQQGASVIVDEADVELLD